MTDLANREPEEITSSSEGLSGEQISEFIEELSDWEVVEGDEFPILRARFAFENFAQALAFTNAVGELAEDVNHHPELTTEWGAVTVKWWTHAVRGLHVNDFILAARTSQLKG